MAKQTFVVYKSYLGRFSKLNDEQMGKLFRAILEYENSGEQPDFDDAKVEASFEVVKYDLDENDAAYERTCAKRRESGALGGKQKAANATKCYQMLPNDSKSKQMRYDNEYDNDNDRDNKTFIPSEKGLKEKDAYASQKESVEKIVERWNQLPDCVPKVKAIDMAAERFKMLKERLKTYSLDGILSAIDNIENSPFLLGDNKNRWTIKFDWFVRPNNFPKVYEGQYCDSGVTITTPRVARGISIVDEMIARGELPNDD